MDRFIDFFIRIKTRFYINLKSNMDRFIAESKIKMYCQFLNLKSNMDRFIARTLICIHIALSDLKSNMDRFIAL